MTIRKKAEYIVVEAKTEAEWLNNRKVYLTASDTASAVGKSKWKSPLDLWGEKTGLRQPKDLSNNPYVIRGKEREAIIRDAFIKDNIWCAVTHHPYNIYVSNRDGFGMLGASLDGELRVLAENPYNLPIGAEGVLEIKTVSATDYNRDVVDGWLDGIIPDYYLPQVHQQIFCKNLDFALVVAELDFGEDIEERYKILPPILVEADREFLAIEQTVNEARTFWDYVESKTPPPTFVEAQVEECTELVPILADAEVGSFYQNFDIVKGSIENIVEPYRGLVFTEENAKEAKEIKANLNKMAKEIDQKRIAVKKKYLQPLEYFESKANELKSVITEVIAPISEQINEFEMQREEEKRDWIEGICSELVLTELSEDVGRLYLSAGGVDFDKRWLNKSFKEADIRKAIIDQISSFKNGYESIVSFASDDSEMLSLMLSEFSRTKDLASAMKAKERILAVREQAKMEEARKKASEQLARMKAQEAQRAIEADKPAEPVVAPAPAPAEEQTQEAELITFTFRATHASKSEWKALIAYMKEHGFTYERIN